MATKLHCDNCDAVMTQSGFPVEYNRLRVVIVDRDGDVCEFCEVCVRQAVQGGLLPKKGVKHAGISSAGEAAEDPSDD